MTGILKRSSTVLKIAVACLLVVFILLVVGFATNYWSIVTRVFTLNNGQKEEFKQRLGLWQECSCAMDICACTERQNTPDWFKAVQALMTLAVIGLVVALILSCLLLCVTQSRKLKIANVAIIAISGIFIIVAVILYGTKDENFSYQVPAIFQSLVDVDTDHDYGYSYILCYVAVAIIFLICLSLFVWDIRVPIKHREVHVHHYRREPYPQVYERRPHYMYATPSYATSSYAPPSYHSYSGYNTRPHVSYVDQQYAPSSYSMEKPKYKPENDWTFNVLSDRAASRRY